MTASARGDFAAPATADVASEMRRIWTIAAMAAITALTAACGGHGEGEEKAEKSGAGAQTVSVQTATVRYLSRTVTASGTVSAWEEVPVGAETGGLVATAVYVDEGSYVRQGQPLVQMNTALLNAQVRQQQAAVQTAEANAARDDAALARAQELKERGFLSQAALDTALANQRSAQANLASAQASLSETRTRLSQATIRAPVSGLVISRSVTRGQIIQAGNELFRIVRDGRVELDAQVPETELALVRSGQTATVTSSQAAPTSGRVRIVTPEVDAQTRLGLARISLAAGSGLRPGMFARADIDVGAQPATVVPTAAVLYRNNKAGVFLLQTDSSVRFQPVTVLSRDDQNTSVSGVNVGAQVIVQGAGFLSDGNRVRVARPGADPAAAPAAKAD